MIINNKTIAELAAKIKTLSLEGVMWSDVTDLSNDARLIKCSARDNVCHALYIGTKFIAHLRDFSADNLEEVITNGLKPHIHDETHRRGKELLNYVDFRTSESIPDGGVINFDNIAITVNKIPDVDLGIIKIYDELEKQEKLVSSSIFEWLNMASVKSSALTWIPGIYYQRILNGDVKYEIK